MTDEERVEPIFDDPERRTTEITNQWNYLQQED